MAVNIEKYGSIVNQIWRHIVWCTGNNFIQKTFGLADFDEKFTLLQINIPFPSFTESCSSTSIIV